MSNLMEQIQIYIDTMSTYPADEYAGKFTSLVDVNLFSGSNDLFRNSVGGFFFNSLDPDEQLHVPPNFRRFLYLDNINPEIYSINSYKGSQINRNINFVQSGIDSEPDPTLGAIQRTGVTSQNTLLPSVKFVCQVQGDPRAQLLQDPVTGNKYWEKLFTGGNFNNQNIEPIYSTESFDAHYTLINLPYDKINLKLLKSGPSIRKFTEISYDYNTYNPMYQNFVSSLSSEKQNLNWYLLNMYSLNFSTDNISKSHYNFSLVEQPIKAFDTNPKDYLNTVRTNILNSSVQVSSEFEARQTNLLFNNNSVRNLLVPNSDANTLSSLLPYYTKISVDTEESAVYSEIIKSENYSTNLLKTLKEVFLQQTQAAPKLEEINFTVNQRAMVSSISDNIDKSVTTSDTQTFKGLDFVEMLLYSHNQIKNEQNDFTVIDEENSESKAAYDNKGTYRAYNTKNTLSVLNRTIATLNGQDAAFYMSDLNSIMNVQNKTTDFDISDLSSIFPEPKYNEVIAYRVEKIAGLTTGDSNTQNVIQNFWIFNSDELTTLDLKDTQTKYGVQYTYKIYAYYIIKGYKYQFSDLQLTKVIGVAREDDSISSDTNALTGIASKGVSSDNPIKGYCVEYFDPTTQQSVRDLLDRAVGDIADTGTVSSIAKEDQVRIRNSSVSSLSGDPLPPYFANFVTTVQPSLKLVEVPIQTKSMAVLDHLPNRVNVEPSFEIKNTNKLLFNLTYQEFNPELYTEITSNNELFFKDTYLKSNDLTEISKLQKESVSPARFIDVYRTSDKPKSYSDFEGNLITTIDKKIKNHNNAYKFCRYSDIVKSNQKYYYLFKTRNELGVEGHVSQIIEAELINDGGYKYATFDVVNKSEMLVDKFKNISESVNRILQVSPKISQISFDDSEVDYSKTAASQIDKIKIGVADDLIWNKTFKLRLTSKKTGKKIDLNITYSEPNANLDE